MTRKARKRYQPRAIKPVGPMPWETHGLDPGVIVQVVRRHSMERHIFPDGQVLERTTEETFRVPADYAQPRESPRNRKRLVALGLVLLGLAGAVLETVSHAATILSVAVQLGLLPSKTSPPTQLAAVVQVPPVHPAAPKIGHGGTRNGHKGNEH